MTQRHEQRCPDCGRWMGDGHHCPVGSPIEENRDQRIEFERREDGTYVASAEKHPDVDSLEELLEAVNADPDRFAVDRWVANQWPTSFAGPDGEPRQVQNRQIKAWLSPKAPEDNPIPAPVQLSVPGLPRARLKHHDGPLQTLHFSDEHIPYHDKPAVNIVYQVAEAHDFGAVFHHGDAVDCSEISEYEKDPHNRVPLQREIELTSRHLGTIHQLTPDAEHVYFLGNHEDRLRRKIWSMAEDRAAEEVLRLPGVQEALEWDHQLGIDELGWRTVPYPEHEVLFDKLVLKHGETVRKHASYSARQEYEKYGKSGVSGHTHRRGVYERRDYNGFHAWWELGCLCDLNPGYTEFPNWQHGFAVITWSEDREHFELEPVRIHGGVTYFRGQRYEGDSKLFGEVAA